MRPKDSQPRGLINGKFYDKLNQLLELGKLNLKRFNTLDTSDAIGSFLQIMDIPESSKVLVKYHSRTPAGLSRADNKEVGNEFRTVLDRDSKLMQYLRPMKEGKPSPEGLALFSFAFRNAAIAIDPEHAAAYLDAPAESWDPDDKNKRPKLVSADYATATVIKIDDIRHKHRNRFTVVESFSKAKDFFNSLESSNIRVQDDHDALKYYKEPAPLGFASSTVSRYQNEKLAKLWEDDTEPAEAVKEKSSQDFAKASEILKPAIMALEKELGPIIVFLSEIAKNHKDQEYMKRADHAVKSLLALLHQEQRFLKDIASLNPSFVALLDSLTDLRDEANGRIDLDIAYLFDVIIKKIRPLLEHWNIILIDPAIDKDMFDPSLHDKAQLSGILTNRVPDGTIIGVRKLGFSNAETGKQIRKPEVFIAEDPYKAEAQKNKEETGSPEQDQDLDIENLIKGYNLVATGDMDRVVLHEAIRKGGYPYKNFAINNPVESGFKGADAEFALVKDDFDSTMIFIPKSNSNEGWVFPDPQIPPLRDHILGASWYEAFDFDRKGLYGRYKVIEPAQARLDGEKVIITKKGKLEFLGQ